MAAGFTDLVLLTQDSAGVRSLYSSSILQTYYTNAHAALFPQCAIVCILTHIRSYFANGTLPVPGTVCSPEDPIFPDHISSNKATRALISSLAAEGKDIYDVAQVLKKKTLFRPHMFRGAI